MSVDERLPEPEVLRTGGFRLATRLYAPGDVRGTRRQLDAFREYAQTADPLADDLVALIERLPDGDERRRRPPRPEGAREQPGEHLRHTEGHRARCHPGQRAPAPRAAAHRSMVAPCGPAWVTVLSRCAGRRGGGGAVRSW